MCLRYVRYLLWRRPPEHVVVEDMNLKMFPKEVSDEVGKMLKPEDQAKLREVMKAHEEPTKIHMVSFCGKGPKLLYLHVKYSPDHGYTFHFNQGKENEEEEEEEKDKKKENKEGLKLVIDYGNKKSVKGFRPKTSSMDTPEAQAAKFMRAFLMWNLPIKVLSVQGQFAGEVKKEGDPEWNCTVEHADLIDDQVTAISMIPKFLDVIDVSNNTRFVLMSPVWSEILKSDHFQNPNSLMRLVGLGPDGIGHQGFEVVNSNNLELENATDEQVFDVFARRFAEDKLPQDFVSVYVSNLSNPFEPEHLLGNLNFKPATRIFLQRLRYPFNPNPTMQYVLAMSAQKKFGLVEIGSHSVKLIKLKEAFLDKYEHVREHLLDYMDKDDDFFN